VVGFGFGTRGDRGESYEDAARREMAEEIGAKSDLEFLDKYIIRGPDESEYSAVYRTFLNGPFHLDPVEIETGGYFNLESVKNKQWNKLTPSSRTVLGNLGKKGLLYV